MASFQEILNKPAAQIEAPKPLAIGTYLCIVNGQPEFAKIGKDQTDCLNVTLKPIQAQADVDQESLSQSLGEGASLQDKKIFYRFFLTDAAIHRLKKFMEDCALELGTRSVGELIPELMGKQVLVQVGHRPSDDGTTIYQDVKGSAKV